MKHREQAKAKKGTTPRFGETNSELISRAPQVDSVFKSLEQSMLHILGFRDSKTGAPAQTLLMAFLVLLVVPLGCNPIADTGSRRPDSPTQTSPTPPPSPGGGGTPAELAFATSGFSANLEFQIAPNNLLGLTFTLQASGHEVYVKGLHFAANGTLNETSLGQALLLEDIDFDGEVDPGELAAPISSTTAPAVLVDNGTISFNELANNPLTLQPGGPRQFFVVLDGTALLPTPSLVGSTLVLAPDGGVNGIAAVDSQGLTVLATGKFTPPNPAVTLGIHDHLLISELNSLGQNNSGQYIEIYNPTPQTISLRHYYLSTVNGASTNDYFAISQGPLGNFSPLGSAAPGNNEFVVRFPATATIASGQALLIAMEGTSFNNSPAFNAKAEFAMRNPQGGSTQAQMLTWDGATFSATPLNIFISFNINFGVITLFEWNDSTQPDLLTDIDIFAYGLSAGAAEFIDKTGVSLDGVDVDAIASTFNADTSPASQKAALSHAISGGAGTASHRVDFTEGTESSSTGNGFNGDIETSENLNVTFLTGTPSPGLVP